MQIKAKTTVVMNPSYYTVNNKLIKHFDLRGVQLRSKAAAEEKVFVNIPARVTLKIKGDWYTLGDVVDRVKAYQGLHNVQGDVQAIVSKDIKRNKRDLIASFVGFGMCTTTAIGASILTALNEASTPVYIAALSGGAAYALTFGKFVLHKIDSVSDAADFYRHLSELDRKVPFLF